METLNAVFAVAIAASFSWWLARNWAWTQELGGMDKYAAWAALGLAILGYAEGFMQLASPVFLQLGWLDFRYAVGVINLLYVVSKPFMALFALVLIARDLFDFGWGKLTQLIYDVMVFLANALQYQRWSDTLPGVLVDFVNQPGAFSGVAWVLFFLSLVVGYGLARVTGTILVRVFKT